MLVTSVALIGASPRLDSTVTIRKADSRDGLFTGYFLILHFFALNTHVQRCCLLLFLSSMNVELINETLQSHTHSNIYEYHGLIYLYASSYMYIIHIIHGGLYKHSPL